ncbi:MAG TPA: sigma-70 family RNA polymerase sigma factor [Polyangiaceae bacterium]
MPSRTLTQEPGPHPAGYGNRVVRLPIPESDGALVARLRSEPERARAALYDRYSADVLRVLCRVLGPDSELDDLLHEVFIVAMASIDKLRNENALRHWVTGIAIRKARRLIRWRKLRRLVKFVAPQDLPEREAITAPAEVTDALRQTYRILESLPTEDRIAFTLRQIDGMELAAIAELTGVSLATVKRRVARAQKSFVASARQDEVLAEWLERGTMLQ